MREKSLSSGTSARDEGKSARRNGKRSLAMTETDEGTTETTATKTAGDTTTGIGADIAHTWTVRDDFCDL